MPFCVIATVPMGAESSTAADHPAAGLIVDAWHVFRAGTPLSELSAVLKPELCSVSSSTTPHPRSSERFSRTPWNAGCSAAKDLSTCLALIAVLRDKGFDGPWGVEILSASFRQLPVDRAVKLAADSALTVL